MEKDRTGEQCYSLEAPVTVTESHHHSPTMAMVVIGIGY